MKRCIWSWGLSMAALLLWASVASAQPGGGAAGTGPAGDERPPAVKPAEKPSQVDATDLKRLDPSCDVWVDAKNKQVILEGEVCLREAPLELFACMRGYKEHEAVVRINTMAFVVHAALLAVGAKPGSPVQFRPKFVPASGTTVDIDVHWTDERGMKQRARAQDWIRDNKTKKEMSQSWVFGGSRFWKDEEGHEHYAAEGGDFICVSNFPGAMLDLPIESTDANEDLLFEAFTDHIPPRMTKVTLVLKPRLEEAKPASQDAQGAPPGASSSGAK